MDRPKTSSKKSSPSAIMISALSVVTISWFRVYATVDEFGTSMVMVSLIPRVLST